MTLTVEQTIAAVIAKRDREKPRSHQRIYLDQLLVVLRKEELRQIVRARRREQRKHAA